MRAVAHGVDGAAVAHGGLRVHAVVADVADVLVGEAPADADEVLHLENGHVPAVAMLLEQLRLGVGATAPQAAGGRLVAGVGGGDDLQHAVAAVEQHVEQF